jgi:hypothetical protein
MFDCEHCQASWLLITNYYTYILHVSTDLSIGYVSTDAFNPVLKDGKDGGENII